MRAVGLQPEEVVTLRYKHIDNEKGILHERENEIMRLTGSSSVHIVLLFPNFHSDLAKGFYDILPNQNHIQLVTYWQIPDVLFKCLHLKCRSETLSSVSATILFFLLLLILHRSNYKSLQPPVVRETKLTQLTPCDSSAVRLLSRSALVSTEPAVVWVFSGS